MAMDRLCYYDKIAKKLSGSQLAKAVRFNKYKKIIKVSNNKYEILPLKGYNSSVYDVSKHNKDYSCNCQWHTMHGLYCSHILGVLLYEKLSDKK